jgi:hypothetical protein
MHIFTSGKYRCELPSRPNQNFVRPIGEIYGPLASALQNDTSQAGLFYASGNSPCRVRSVTISIENYFCSPSSSKPDGYGGSRFVKFAQLL